MSEKTMIQKDKSKGLILSTREIRHWILSALLRLSPYGEKSSLRIRIVFKLCTFALKINRLKMLNNCK